MRQIIVTSKARKLAKPQVPASQTSIANEALRDSRLSYRARGVLAACLTHPKDSCFTKQWIASHGTEGRDAITTAIRELRELGYVHDEWVVEGGVLKRRILWSDAPSTELLVEAVEREVKGNG